MRKYGWHEGQSLGSSVRGIVDALDAEGGQKPSDKRGFGYEILNCLSFSRCLDLYNSYTGIASCKLTNDVMTVC